MTKKVNNKKKTTKKMSREVKSSTRNIQNANYIAKNRLVKFTDYRSFIVVDNGGTTIPPASYPALIQLSLNNPRKFIESKQGTWNENNLGAKGAGVPGITKWLANKIPGTTSTSDYLTASCKGCRIVCTVTPIPVSDSDYDTYQPVVKVALSNQTREGHLKGRAVDTVLNSERVSQLPMTRSGNVYLNHGGTPRGITLSMNYSYKSNNADPGKAG